METNTDTPETNMKNKLKSSCPSDAMPCSASLEIWVNNPNSCMGWVRHSGPFTSRTKTEKRVRDIKLFDAVKGCRFQIRSLPNDQGAGTDASEKTPTTKSNV
jgi:hypothetical protein